MTEDKVTAEENVTTPLPETTKSTQPEYITREDFDKFTESLKGNMSKNFRAVQSQTDRYQDVVKQSLSELDKHLLMLSESGIVVDTKIARDMRNQVKLDALAGAEPLPDTKTDASQLPESAQPKDYLTTEMWKMMDEAGVDILESDPEAEELAKLPKGITNYKYLKAVEEALEKKRKRIEKGTDTPAGSPETAVGGIPSLSGGGKGVSNPIEGIMDSNQLFEIAKKQGKI